MLTPEQRIELERCGAPYIRLKVVNYGGGHDSAIGGFESGNMTRSDIEGWLAEKAGEEAKQQSAILWWAKVAASAGIIGVIVALAGIWISKH